MDMKTVTLELPEKIAAIFEALPKSRKSKIGWLAVTLATAQSKTWEDIFLKTDQAVAKSGLTTEEIDKLLEEIS